MSFLGFVIAMYLFCRFGRRLMTQSSVAAVSDHRGERNSERREQRAERHQRRAERRASSHGCWGWESADGCWNWKSYAAGDTSKAEEPRDSDPGRKTDKKKSTLSPEEQAMKRARRRAAAETGFYGHFVIYLGVIALLAFINLLTTRYPWFIWPAFGWGIGIFSHYMAVFGSQALQRALLRPGGRARGAPREVSSCRPRSRRASTSCRRRSRTRSATRSPRRRAWCSRWAKIRIRSRTSSTRKWRSRSSTVSSVASRTCSSSPRKRTTTVRPVNLAAVVDSALTQMRAKLDAAKVQRGAQLHRRTDGARRRREAAAGVRQRPRQRHRRARERGRGPAHRPLHRERRRQRHRARARQRVRHSGRQGRSDLQPVLHDQGKGHRARHGHHARRSSRRTRARSRSRATAGTGSEFTITLPLPRPNA